MRDEEKHSWFEIVLAAVVVVAILGVPQVFPPFAQDATGKTAYEIMLEGKFLV